MIKELFCNHCNKQTPHLRIRSFDYNKGKKYWYSCTECNTIQLIKEENVK